MAVMVLLMAGSLAGCRAPGVARSAAPFNIITYNVRMNAPADGENAWPFRKDKVAGLLRFHQADIFNVQEALCDQMDDLVARFPDFDHVGVGRDGGKRAGEHMAIFYNRKRFSRINDGMFWLSETPGKPGRGWDAACNRTCTWIELKDNLTGKDLFVLDTHLDHKGRQAREEGVKLILARIREINRENRPLILTGDFNLIKSSAPIRAVLNVLADARDKSATEPYGPQGTAGGFAVKAQSERIDYIFVSNRVTVLRHGVLSDSFGMFHPSDHMPVLAEVRID